MRLSREFVGALKLSKTPAYQLAVKVGISPYQLSRVVRGMLSAERWRKELMRIGRRLGLKPSEMFVD